jgi:hypothetical protein
MKISKIYYLAFDANTAFPMDVPRLKIPPFSLPTRLLAGGDEKIILDTLLKDKICPAKFEEGYVRMVVDVDNGKRSIWLDGHGCVKMGKQEYYIRPGGFLALYNRMEGVKHRHKEQGGDTFP